MITIAVSPFQWLVRLAVKMGIIAQNNTFKKKKCLTIISLQFIWTKDICQLNVSLMVVHQNQRPSGTSVG